MQIPTLGQVIRYKAEKQANQQKYNETMRELLARPIKQNILYDKIQEFVPKSVGMINGQNQVILISRLNVTNVMRLFKEALQI